MKCQYCGAEETLPFDCAYCGNFFCSDHRIPENHQCPELWRAKPPKDYPLTSSPPARRPLGYPYTYARPKTSFSAWLRTEEAKHLTAGAVLVLLVGLSIIAPNFRFLSFPLWMIFLSAGLFAASFLLHELSHKFVAQRNGLWAEFRMTSFGAILTIFSIFSPFKIIAPGAVTISGYANESTFGRVAAAGPITNIALGIIMAAVSLAMPSRLAFFIDLRQVVVYASLINGFLAAFNLIPFGILDGRKVFVWNKMVWAVAFAVAAALTFFAYNL